MNLQLKFMLFTSSSPTRDDLFEVTNMIETYVIAAKIFIVQLLPKKITINGNNFHAKINNKPKKQGVLPGPYAEVEQVRVGFTIASLLAYFWDPRIQDLLQRHFYLIFGTLMYRIYFSANYSLFFGL